MKNGTFDFEGANFFAPHVSWVGPVMTNELTMFRPARDERGRYKHHSCWQHDLCVRVWFNIRVEGQPLPPVMHTLPLPQPDERHAREELARLTWYSSYKRREEVAELVKAQLGSGTVGKLFRLKEMQVEALRQDFIALRDAAVKHVNLIVVDYHDLHGGGMAA